ncbi:hypothetical protein WA1_10225 [Scytonema hofmannii PCC 7110]|uniref:Uncharacterized protein n=1 Tax=Scytonema hofmannii PCC 7110 TaxID=128403 RepID=A0A139WRN6_9CYAN|nr:hypothetical protein WA1_10225 [Scytonema hofmannii PCC 7110]
MWFVGKLKTPFAQLNYASGLLSIKFCLPISDFAIRNHLQYIHKNANILGEDVPITLVIFYKEEDGSVPVLEWLHNLPEKNERRENNN